MVQSHSSISFTSLPAIRFLARKNKQKNLSIHMSSKTGLTALYLESCDNHAEDRKVQMILETPTRKTHSHCYLRNANKDTYSFQVL